MRHQNTDHLSHVTRHTSHNDHSAPVLASVMGQIVVHMASLLAVLRMCEPYVVADAAEMASNATFKPNVINTSVFYMSLCMHTGVYACNYQGAPFMQNLKEYTGLFRILIFTYVLMAVLELELLPGFCEYLELVPAPTQLFKYELAGYMVANTVFAFAWETAVRRMILT
jgi:magnesium-transporting ATPase (P-type)